MYQAVDSTINSPPKEFYVLDYPDKSDLSDFLNYVRHEDAMAEIYFENDVEKLDDETIQLFNNHGKVLHNNKNNNNSNNRCDLMLVLRDNGKVIGFIELRLTKDTENISQLFSLFVSEKYRRKGLGNLMMVYALDFFKNSGQENMTVTHTAESLTVYNKFGFYPPEFHANQESLKNWFKKMEEERLERLKDEPSDFLMMDLTDQSCREAFENHCKKVAPHFVKFEISQDLQKDLKIDVFDWRKKTTATPTLSSGGLGVLSTLDDGKKRKDEPKKSASAAQDEPQTKRLFSNQ
ncbi:GNAT family N-acetyltransferase [Legionella anisa]|uniref:N-acetyltransferase n=1 Tax=Legionella anisa TaxID=28082 RepID=A0AAX0WZY3_9GAMM|nr:GNAT family N-acetyltransferase [Legionella anisa]AWN73593.1 GNAT family N-acetyltransferase [Legionella anisa]KTC73946.1 Acetyltransferase (GNAT) family protein [Legionella anisa]MBN5937505.1 GNAT family N-acetyltransferase [Legionella anisa]MCW8426479.1 GNAT family N-acetyltransferase [Legionella anisa]MCW8448142.1 GNAT family N-acetyltransferase [Legionella anisa]